MIKSFLLDKNECHTNKIEEDFLSAKTILLFQQRGIDAAIVKAILKNLGCNVIASDSVDQSLSILTSQPVDVFISESHLENIDLSSFVKLARESNDILQKNNYKIPILGYTSRELSGEEGNCLASGMDYYIDSPTNTDDLRAILRRFIGRATHMANSS